MIKKIISGGQTGADQAALDAAIKWNIPHGGWIPKGRLTDAGRLPDKYNMQEMPTDSYPARTEQNVIDSDGTLIISHGPLTYGSRYTKEMALKYNKKYLHIDLNLSDVSNAAKQIHNWIIKNKIETLNIAGPKASSDPSIYQVVLHILTIVLIMDFIDIKMSVTQGSLQNRPVTLDRAVDIIISKMSLRERCYIANMFDTDLIYLDITLGALIRKIFGLESGHKELIQSCRVILGKKDINDEELTKIIITELWKKLRETHALRVIK